MVLLHIAKRSVRHRVKQERGRTSHTHAELLHLQKKTHVIPATYPQTSTFFSWQVFSGRSHLYIISRCIPQAGSQNEAEYTLMKGNIHLMLKVNQGDKFKSSLCHCYRKVPQSLIGSIENLKRYRNYCKIDCLL